MISRPKTQAAQSKTVVAPLGGINDIDPIANMGDEYCLDLVNWFPGNVALDVREGYKEWVTGLTGPVRTIVPYYSMNGDYKLFASTDGGIYDVTVSTDTPVLVQASSNGYYKSINYGNVAFQYLVMVNGGAEPGTFYDGTAWIDFVQVDAVGEAIAPGLIFGTNPDYWTNVAVFKRRLWFVQKASMTAWYLPVDAIGGEAKPFYLTGVFKRGGSLRYIVDWSIDSGDGLSNKLIFVSNLGEIAVYSGDNPDEATSWALEAVFYGAAPIGDRSFANFGGDVLMATVGGVIPLSKVLNGLYTEAPEEQVLTKRISRTINRIVLSKQYGLNWDMLYLPNLQALMLILPPNGSLPALQLVMNSLTGAWTKFDVPVNCACSYLGTMYFGTADGKVCIYGANNYLDNVARDGTGGTPVITKMASAYNYMESPGNLKHWTLIRPFIQSSLSPGYIIGLDTDFSLTPIPGDPSLGPEEDGTYLWDTAIWDEAKWSEENFTYTPWIGTEGFGNAVSTLLKTASKRLTTLVALQYIYVEGGMV